MREPVQALLREVMTLLARANAAGPHTAFEAEVLDAAASIYEDAQDDLFDGLPDPAGVTEELELARDVLHELLSDRLAASPD